jgi:hypothetical protein
MAPMSLLSRARRRGRSRRGGRRFADRATLTLAGLAVASAGTVVVGELVRMARRRQESEQVETPGTIASAAELATRDTVKVARKAYQEAPHHETVLFNILSGFLGAFALMRLSTWGIRQGWWPTRDVILGDRHIHHFVPGILIGFAAGGFGLVSDSEATQAKLSIIFGAGAGLTFDEAALLLDLRDVYWTREGLLSIQVSLGISAILGASILTLRMLRRGEAKGVQEGLIPEVHPGAAGALG